MGNVVQLIIILILSSISLSANAGKNRADIPDVWVMLDIQNTTGSGQTQQYASIGFSIKWDHVGFDISHGRKQINDSSWESGTELGIRIYPFRMNKVRPLLVYQHTSDITRSNKEFKPVQDYMGVGATIVFERLELDISFGQKIIDCYGHALPGQCFRDDSIVLGVRFYPFRKTGRSRWINYQ